MKNLNLKQHPLYKDYYGTEDGGVYSKKFKSGRIKQLNPMRCDRCYNMQYSKHKLVDCNAKWYVIENRKTGEIFKIFNLKQWCKENNVDRISAHKVVNGKWRHTKNFIIKKLDTAN